MFLFEKSVGSFGFKIFLFEEYIGSFKTQGFSIFLFEACIGSFETQGLATWHRLSLLVFCEAAGVGQVADVLPEGYYQLALGDALLHQSAEFAKGIFVHASRHIWS